MSKWKKKKTVDEDEEALCDAFEDVSLDTRSTQRTDIASSGTVATVDVVQDSDDMSVLRGGSTQVQHRRSMPSIAEELEGALTRFSLDDSGKQFSTARRLRRESTGSATNTSGQKRMTNRPPSVPLPVTPRTRPRSAGCAFPSSSPLNRLRIRRFTGHCGFEASDSSAINHPGNYTHVRRRRLFHTSPGSRRKRSMGRYNASLLGPIFEEISLLNRITAELDLSCDYTTYTTPRSGSYWSRDLTPDTVPRLMGRQIDVPPPLSLEDPSTSRAATARVTSDDYSESNFYLQQLEVSNQSPRQQLQSPITDTPPATKSNENDELERTFEQLDLSDKKRNHRS